MAQLILDITLAQRDLPKINLKKGHFVSANCNFGAFPSFNIFNNTIMGQIMLPTTDNGEAGALNYLSFLNQNCSGYGWSEVQQFSL